MPIDKAKMILSGKLSAAWPTLVVDLREGFRERVDTVLGTLDPAWRVLNWNLVAGIGGGGLFCGEQIGPSITLNASSRILKRFHLERRQRGWFDAGMVEDGFTSVGSCSPVGGS